MNLFPLTDIQIDRGTATNEILQWNNTTLRFEVRNVLTLDSTSSDHITLNRAGDAGQIYIEGGELVIDSDLGLGIQLKGDTVGNDTIKLDGSGSILGGADFTSTTTGFSMFSDNVLQVRNYGLTGAARARLLRAEVTTGTEDFNPINFVIGTLEVGPWNGTGFGTTTAEMRGVATQQHSLTNFGTKLEFYATPDNSDTQVLAVTIFGEDQKMLVAGDMGVTGRVTITDTSNSQLVLNSTGAGSLDINVVDSVGQVVYTAAGSLPSHLFANDVSVTGDFTVDSPTFHVDSTLDRVGVGSVTPGRLFSVVAGAETAFLQVTNSTVGTTLGNGLELFSATAGSAGIINRETGALSLQSGGAISIDAQGGSYAVQSSLGQFIFRDGATTSFLYEASVSKAQATLIMRDVVGNQLVFANGATVSLDFDHALQTDPTLFIHSDLNPNTSNNQWGSFHHDQEDFIIETGAATGTGSAPTTDRNAIVLNGTGGTVVINDFTVDTDVLVVDSVSDNVSISDNLFLTEGLTSALVNDLNCAMFRTNTSGGSYPFDGFGHLVIQARTSASNRDVVFMSRINSSLNKVVMVIGGSGNVGVGATAPVSMHEVAGSYGKALVTVTGNTTLDDTHSTVLVNASGNVIITLPTAASAFNSTDGVGRIYRIKKIDNDEDTVTVDGNGSETIDGGLTAVITVPFEAITIQTDGSNWHIL